MKAWKWLSVAVLVLAACGKEEEKGVNLTTANSRTENAQPTATALADTDGLNGTLMVVKGNALYYLADEPVKIAEGFDSEAAAFTLSPDRQTLLYVLPGHNDSEFGADLSLMRWDAQTQVSQEIMPLDS
ncbi:MAG TPA: hypothetical protein VHP83_02440, partial [Aggregatilineaceae bacterium]|nr:hypothetical protein [Aggregatilineaceae bacterium]